MTRHVEVEAPAPRCEERGVPEESGESRRCMFTSNGSVHTLNMTPNRGEVFGRAGRGGGKSRIFFVLFFFVVFLLSSPEEKRGGCRSLRVERRGGGGEKLFRQCVLSREALRCVCVCPNGGRTLRMCVCVCVWRLDEGIAIFGVSVSHRGKHVEKGVNKGVRTSPCVEEGSRGCVGQKGVWWGACVWGRDDKGGKKEKLKSEQSK